MYCALVSMFCVCVVLPQPDPPVALTGTSGSIATLAWQVAAKENQLDKVQDELQQVSPCYSLQQSCSCCWSQELPSKQRVGPSMCWSWARLWDSVLPACWLVGCRGAASDRLRVCLCRWHHNRGSHMTHIGLSGAATRTWNPDTLAGQASRRSRAARACHLCCTALPFIMTLLSLCAADCNSGRALD